MAYDLVGLVPMKGHSERVPNKNIRPFNGKPLYHWVVRALLGSGVIDRVLINTDSERILEEAPTLDPRVEVVKRPEELRGDFVPMNDILLHDIDYIESGSFLQTHSTSPLLSAETVGGAVERYRAAKGSDSLFTVTRLQTRLWSPIGEAINHNPDELIRTQDLDPIYEENSGMYIFRPDVLRERKNRIGYHPVMFEMDPVEACDIDGELDFKVAEFLHRERYGE